MQSYASMTSKHEKYQEKLSLAFQSNFALRMTYSQLTSAQLGTYAVRHYINPLIFHSKKNDP